MTGLKSIIVKFSAFALAAVLLGMLLLNTMLNGVNGDTRELKAQFTDVAGLRIGDDVRVAGVRVGRVTAIEITDRGADVTMAVRSKQPVLETTKVVTRYQDLLGQRYLALVQEGRRGTEMRPGATIPIARTSPGFDLTELLNGFRPLFETLKPEDVNTLATSLVKVLQGEGGTVETLLAQTSSLTNRVADRDEVFDRVLTNLTPVLQNMDGQGTELRATVRELRALMTGLARDRQSIGSSIDGMSQLIRDTSNLLRDAREPSAAAVDRFREVMKLFADNRDPFMESLKSFERGLGALGRTGSYANSLNIYLCSVVLAVGDVKLNLNGTPDGPFSEVCR